MTTTLRHFRSRPLRAARTGLAAAALAALTATATAAPPGPLTFGAYDPEGYFADDAEVGIEHVFLPWQDVDLSSLSVADDYARERNRPLLITIEPWTWTRDERNTAEFLRAGIRDGLYDANIRDICAVIQTLQSPVSVRWAHEMDATTGHFIWSDWQPQDYIDAYRRIMSLCKEAAPRANLVWSPSGFENANDFYPGDDLVDVVGLSIFGFQPYDQATLGRPGSFEQMLQERYDRVKIHGKPVLVAEVGYSGDAAYVAQWDGEVRRARPDMPLLAGVVYFNQREVYPWPDGFGLPDWRVETRIIP